MRVVTPKTPVDECLWGGDTPSIFLGGSIEMDAAEQWQAVVIDRLTHHNVVLLNPRRDDWDSKITQRADDSQFRQQVEWELSMLEASDLIMLYFQPGTVSPISLLELGLFASVPYQNIVVCCPEGFHRKGNVDIICERYHVPSCNTFEELLNYTEAWIKEVIMFRGNEYGTI